MADKKLEQLRDIPSQDVTDEALAYIKNPSAPDDDPEGQNPKDRSATVASLKAVFKTPDSDIDSRVEAGVEDFARQGNLALVPESKIPILGEGKLDSGVQQKLNKPVEFDFPDTQADLAKKQRLLSQQIDLARVPEERGDITFGASNADNIYYRKEGAGGTQGLTDEVSFSFAQVGTHWEWASNHNLAGQINRGSVDGEIGDEFGSLISIIASGSPQIRWKPSGEDIIGVYDATNDVYYHLPSNQNTTSASWHFRVLPAGLVTAINTAANAGTPLKLKIIYHYGKTAKVTKKGTFGSSDEPTFIFGSSLPSGWGVKGWFRGIDGSSSSTGLVSNGVLDTQLTQEPEDGKFGTLLLLSNTRVVVSSASGNNGRVSNIKDLDDDTDYPLTLANFSNLVQNFGAAVWAATPAGLATKITNNVKLRLEITYQNGVKAKVSTFTAIPAVGSVTDDLKNSPLEQINKNSNGDIFIYQDSSEDTITELDVDNKEINLVAHIWAELPAQSQYYIRLRPGNREFALLNPYLEYGTEHAFSVHTAGQSWGYVGETTEETSNKEFDAGGLAVIASNSEIIPAQGKTSLSITLSDQASGDAGEYRTGDVYNGIGAAGSSDSPMYLQAFNENTMVILKSIYDREFTEDDNPVVKVKIGSREYDLYNLSIKYGSALGFNGHGERDISPFGKFIRLQFGSLNLMDLGQKRDFSLIKKNKELVKFRIINKESAKVFTGVEVFGAVNGRPPKDFNSIIRPGIFHFGQGSVHTNGPDGIEEKIYQGILQSVYLEAGGFRPGKITSASAYVEPAAASSEVRFFGPTVHSEKGLRVEQTDSIKFKFEASGGGYAWTDYSLVPIAGQDNSGSIENGVAGDGFGRLFGISVVSAGSLGYLFTKGDGSVYVTKFKVGGTAEVNINPSLSNVTLGGVAVKRQSIPSTARQNLFSAVNVQGAGGPVTLKITYSDGTTAKVDFAGEFHHGSVRIEYDGHDIPYYLQFSTYANAQVKFYIPDVWANLINGEGETVKVTVKIGNKTVERTISLDPDAETTEEVSGVELNGLPVTKIYRSAIAAEAGAWPAPSAAGAYDEVEIDMEWTHNNIATGGVVHETGLLHYWVSEKQKISKRFQVGAEGSFEEITADWQQVKPEDKNKIIIERIEEVPNTQAGIAKLPKLSMLEAPQGDYHSGLYLRYTKGTNGSEWGLGYIDELFSDYAEPPTHKTRLTVPTNPSVGDTFRAEQDIYPNQDEPLNVVITPASFSDENTLRFGYRSDQYGDAHGSISLDPTKKLGSAYSFNYQSGGWVTLIALKKSDHPDNISGGLNVGKRKLSSVKLKVPVDAAYNLTFREEETKNSVVFWSYRVEGANINLFPVGQKIPIDLRAQGNLVWPQLHFEAGKYYRFLASGVWEEFTP